MPAGAELLRLSGLPSPGGMSKRAEGLFVGGLRIASRNLSQGVSRPSRLSDPWYLSFGTPLTRPYHEVELPRSRLRRRLR